MEIRTARRITPQKVDKGIHVDRGIHWWWSRVGDSGRRDSLVLWWLKRLTCRRLMNVTKQKADEDTPMLTVLGDMIVLGDSAWKGWWVRSDEELIKPSWMIRTRTDGKGLQSLCIQLRWRVVHAWWRIDYTSLDDSDSHRWRIKWSHNRTGRQGHETRRTPELKR